MKETYFYRPLKSHLNPIKVVTVATKTKQKCFTVLVVGVMPPKGKCDVQNMPYHSTTK